ncbi:Cysteine-rich receptor-like protein kinase 10 [Hordeum vulgare]|nr:Cysteine-rich receptor-like protein kinase 10 [Hordeum vulgare]
MEKASSSSPGSRSRSFVSPTLLPVKLEPQETSLERCTRNNDIVINKPDTSSCLVKPRTELRLLPVKQEHPAMAAADETALKWVRDNYVREEMERQRRPLDEIAARCHDREEGGVMILDDTYEEAPGPPKKDSDGAQDDYCDDDYDYTNFYNLLDM